MDHTAHYCSIRRDLEHQSWILVSRHAELAHRLYRLIGGERDDFLTMLDRCEMAELDFHEARDNLREHREVHRC